MAKKLPDFYERICPVCRKNFILAPYHVYRIGDRNPVCSWSCVVKHEREKEQKKKKRKRDADES